MASAAVKTRLDLATLAGMIGGPMFILVGQYSEGGKLGSLLQLSAAMIVIGGTLGAVMISFSPSYLLAAVRDLRKVISEDAPDPYDLIERIVACAAALRKEGPLALEKYAKSESYWMLATGLNLVVNNLPEETIKMIMERALHERGLRNSAGAEVFEAAGGYFPTFGILGAVLGLIHTMSEMSDPTKVGAGISVAFVATVYGVGIANLIAFPAAKKIRTRAQAEKQLDKIVVTGISGLRAGQSSSQLRQLLTEGLQQAPAAKADAAPARAA